MDVHRPGFKFQLPCILTLSLKGSFILFVFSSLSNSFPPFLVPLSMQALCLVVNNSHIHLEHTHTCSHIFAHTYTHTFICIHAHTPIHSYVYIYTHMHIRRQIQTYTQNTQVYNTNVYTCTHICMHVYLAFCP